MKHFFKDLMFDVDVFILQKKVSHYVCLMTLDPELAQPPWRKIEMVLQMFK